MSYESIPLETSKKKPLNPEGLARHQKNVQAYEALAPASNPASPLHMETVSNIGPLLVQEYLAEKGISPRARETFGMLAQRIRREMTENQRMAGKLATIPFDDRLITQLLSGFEKITKLVKEIKANKAKAKTIIAQSGMDSQSAELLNQIMDVEEDNEKQYYTLLYMLLQNSLDNIVNQKAQESTDLAA